MKTRVRAKICGITRADDAVLAAELGADAIGFIAVPGSPRFVTPEIVSEIRRALPPWVSTVVVAKTAEGGAAYDVDQLQFYDGEPDPKRPSIKVFRLKDEASLSELLDDRSDVCGYLIDAWHPVALGGVGERVDTSLAAAAISGRSEPVILAGGLNPDNIGEALAALSPWGADVSSGVEIAPGIKDAKKLEAFLSAVARASRRDH